VVAQTAAAVRHELVGLGGVVERNWYLVKRYVWWEVAFFLWTCANTLTIVFIAKGVGASPAEQNQLATTLLIGGVIWAYLGIIFEILTETGLVGAVGRDDRVHVHGAALAAHPPVRHGLVRRRVRRRAREPALRRDRLVLLAAPARCQLRGGPRVARDRVGVFHRDLA
jgi:ABC-2 type transport system permease protein